jgi:hypothetical protein
VSRSAFAVFADGRSDLSGGGAQVGGRGLQLVLCLFEALATVVDRSHE